MKNTVFSASLKTLALAMLIIASLAGPSFAADVYLVAQEFQTDVGGGLITMWGFAPADAGFTPTDDPSVPGPMITGVAEGDTLSIHVQNNLTTDISIVIPGLPTTLSPFRDVDGRVKSFTARTAPGGNATYTWTDVKPGSYIYQSGTHPAVQVQMGLIGGLIVQPALGADHVYNDGATQFGNEITLFFHEIDPVLHAAVANGDYGTPIYPSTIHYAPRYFLINGDLRPAAPGAGAGPLTSGLAVTPNPTGGAPFVTLTGTAENLAAPASEGMLSLLNLTAGQPTALRFFNGGLEDDAPTLEGGLYMDLLGEYGAPYPYPKTQYSALLPAGKTIDAIVTADATGAYALYDRRLNLASSSGVAAAEWWTGADPGEGAGTPMAAADGFFYSGIEALTASIDVSAWTSGTFPVINVRSQNMAGNWGPAAATALHVSNGFVDQVVISQTLHIGGTLGIVAATNALPGTVTLTATGYGVLTYHDNPLDPFYNMYTGVFAEPIAPAEVTVTSSLGGSDTRPVPWPLAAALSPDVVTSENNVVIVKSFLARDGRVTVVAVVTDAAPGSVSFIAEGYGPLRGYLPRRNLYYGVFWTQPDKGEITVSISGGGSDTQAIPYP
jgi:hypothetical protein